MHESITTISPVVSSSHAFQRWKQKQPGTSTHQSSDASAATNEQAPGWACVDSNAQAQRRGGRGGPATGDAATTREKGRPAVARAHGRTKGEHVEGWLPVSSSFAARRWLLMEGGGASGVELGGGGQREMAVAIGCRGGEGMRRGGGSPLTDDAGGEGRTSSKSWLLRAMTSHVRSVVPKCPQMERRQKANTGKRKTRDGRGRARLWTSFATALPYRAPVVPCVSYLPRPMPVFTTKRLHISSPLPVAARLRH
ncbi:hypothetical protein OsJ_21760 [Oryza sativa Japonica Group]|uniref:Uncharacterized protein n=1 Tax=Oryza sativa subsp. japonica TaxID=39947 RepID=B9FTV0_ORYSJ|nr:hypothetical protein OsJ_21760 [Oryza sativa Japonica Group]